MQRFFAHLCAWWPVRRAGLWSQAIMMAAIAAFAVGEAIAYGLGGSLYQGKALSLGAVYLVVAYTALLAAPIETIRTQLQDLQQADAAIARVRELLETRSRLDDGTEDLPGGARLLVPPRVAYSAQAPTLISGTLRENILLGLPEVIVSQLAVAPQ